MRNNRLTTNTTDPVTDSRPGGTYDSIPFKNKDIDRLQPRELPEYKSAPQYNVDNDARRAAKRKLEEGAKRKLRKNKS